MEETSPVKFSSDSLFLLRACANLALNGLEKDHWTLVNHIGDCNELDQSEANKILYHIASKRGKIEKAVTELSLLFEYLHTGKHPSLDGNVKK